MTAKLSRKFYEKFGDELTNELVDWFNQVDATYRGELRDLNELNYARFDAKLEQRAAQLDAKLEQRTAELKADLQAGLAGLEGRLLARMGVLEGALVGRIGAAERRLARLSFLFWAGLLAIVIGLLKL